MSPETGTKVHDWLSMRPPLGRFQRQLIVNCACRHVIHRSVCAFVRKQFPRRRYDVTGPTWWNAVALFCIVEVTRSYRPIVTFLGAETEGATTPSSAQISTKYEPRPASLLPSVFPSQTHSFEPEPRLFSMSV